VNKDEYRARKHIADELRKIANQVEDFNETVVEFEVKNHFRRVIRDGDHAYRLEPTGGRTITMILGSYDREETIDMRRMWGP
jgi:hypothetical protein